MRMRPIIMRSRRTGAAPASSKPKPADAGAWKVVRVERVVEPPQLSGRGGTTTERALATGAGSPISAASKTAFGDAEAPGRAVAQAPVRSRMDTQVRTSWGSSASGVPRARPTYSAGCGGLGVHCRGPGVPGGGPIVLVLVLVTRVEGFENENENGYESAPAAGALRAHPEVARLFEAPFPEAGADEFAGST